ncbi:MAG: hypothetical protein ACOZQL_23305 [Myxococcota bacterium]
MNARLDIRVASPCSEKWESMVGDERKRFCAKCQLHVHDLKAYSEDEVRALLDVKAGERVCGRVYRRFDGTVLLKDCPTGVARLRKRALLGLSLAATVVLAVLGFGLIRVKQCLVSPDDSWFDRTIGARVVAARELLRETRTFGPLIDEYFPQPATFTAGAIIAVPPASSGSP